MEKKFMKGTEAIAEAAVRAGCRFFAGYPITPQNEIPEYFARRMPEVGGVFVQGESETGSANMLYGAVATGTRCMSSSSSIGISLYSEGISACASARMPLVYVNVQRGGPGVGVIQPAQQDYFQATKAQGNGGFRMMVWAPATVQEAVDMTYHAFDYAERDENPVLILTDGVVGTMMEAVDLPDMKSDEEIAALKQKFDHRAITGHPFEQINKCHSGGCGGLKTDDNIAAAAMYQSWEKDVAVETDGLEDAELVITAYGITARIVKAAIRRLRADGFKVGLIRPKTVSPFPYDTYERLDYTKVKGIVSAELAIPAQFAYDVGFAVKGRCPIRECLTSGGELITSAQVEQAVREMAKEVL